VAASPARDAVAPPRLTSVPALAEVYRRHAGDVARWAARLGGPRIEVDDVVQEVFIIVGRQLPQFRGEAKLGTWLFRITDRVVRNQRRWWAVRRIVTRLTSAHGERLCAPDGDPREAVERRAAVATAYRLLDQLPEKYRRILILFELEELPADEIASLLGARVETVRVWLHRARRLFLERQQALEAEEEIA
jgi:RNA polymerase sigma-70 factor, ECF subfamily